MFVNILPAIPPLPQQASCPEREIKRIPIRRRTPVPLKRRRVSKLCSDGHDLEITEGNLRVRQVGRDAVVVGSKSGPGHVAHQVEVRGLVEVVEPLAGIGVVFADGIAEVGEVFVVLQDFCFGGLERGVVVLVKR